MSNEKKDIRDYLKFYIGCEVMTTDPQTDETSKGYLTGIAEWPEESVEIQLHNFIHADEEPTYKAYSDVKPILRRLESMTEEEMAELFWLDNKSFKEMEGVFKLHIDNSRPRFGIRVMLEKDGKHFMTGTLSMSRFNPEQFQYLLSKHFDIFNLIPDLAIEQTNY